MHACVCKWMSSLHAFAILFSGCVHMQNSKPVTWLKCQVVHLQLFWPQVEISLRFQLACLASSAKQADWLNLSKFCWFRRHWSCGPRCRDCSSGPSTKSLNCLRFRLLKMVNLAAVVAASSPACFDFQSKNAWHDQLKRCCRHFLVRSIEPFLLQLHCAKFLWYWMDRAIWSFFPVDCSSCFKL